MNANRLRRFWLLLLVLPCICGCTSIDAVRTRVKERIVGVPPTVRTVVGSMPQVFQAARRVMVRFGYKITESGPAEGRLEGLSRVLSNDNFVSSRQRGIKIQLLKLDGGQVEIQLRMAEIIEESTNRSGMPATETPVRDPSIYDAFFDEVNRELTPPAQPAAARQPSPPAQTR